MEGDGRLVKVCVTGAFDKNRDGVVGANAATAAAEGWGGDGFSMSPSEGRVRDRCGEACLWGYVEEEIENLFFNFILLGLALLAVFLGEGIDRQVIVLVSGESGSGGGVVVLFNNERDAGWFV